MLCPKLLLHIGVDSNIGRFYFEEFRRDIRERILPLSIVLGVLFHGRHDLGECFIALLLILEVIDDILSVCPIIEKRKVVLKGRQSLRLELHLIGTWSIVEMLNGCNLNRGRDIRFVIAR